MSRGLSRLRPALLPAHLGQFLLGDSASSHPAPVHPYPGPAGRPAAGTPALCVPDSTAGSQRGSPVPCVIRERRKSRVHFLPRVLRGVCGPLSFCWGHVARITDDVENANTSLCYISLCIHECGCLLFWGSNESNRCFWDITKSCVDHGRSHFFPIASHYISLTGLYLHIVSQAGFDFTEISCPYLRMLGLNAYAITPS